MAASSYGLDKSWQQAKAKLKAKVADAKQMKKQLKALYVKGLKQKQAPTHRRSRALP